MSSKEYLTGRPSRLTKEIIETIELLLNIGTSKKEISNIMGFSPRHIRRIRRGEYAHLKETRP